MGYYTRFTGQIDINPPLIWKEIRDCEWIGEGYSDLKFKVETIKEETDKGTLILKRAVAIVPLTDDSYKGYGALDCLKKMIQTYPDRDFTGCILAEGEEAGDIRRFLVKDGQAIAQTATFTFDE